MNRKESVKRGVWYIGGRRTRRRGQKGGFLPIDGLLESVASPLIGEIAKPILRKIVGGRKAKRRRYIKKARNATVSKTAKRTIIFSKVRESEQAKFTSQRDSKMGKTNRTEKQEKT